MNRFLLSTTILIILLLVYNSTYSAIANNDDINKDKHEDTSHFLLNNSKRGERIFKGIQLQSSKNKACTSCHNIKLSDTLNWNPSAIDIAKTFANKNISDFKMVLINPTNEFMSKVHFGYKFNDKEITYIKSYLYSLEVQNEHPEKLKINKILLFLFLGLVITLCIIDLVFSKKIKIKAIPVIILMIALSYQAKMIHNVSTNLGRHQNYAPDQPIKFSHKIHSTDNKIECRYCHSGVENSKSAIIPSVNTCMNCHLMVREGRNSGKFEINKIYKAIDNKKPIEWIRIHKLPDHVFFSHAQHVKVGKRECNECHGDIENMDIVKQEHDLSMGWCLDCHEKTIVDFNSNPYYSKGFRKLHDDLEKGKIDSIRVKDIGGKECARCHY